MQVPNHWTRTKSTPRKNYFFLLKSLNEWGYGNLSHRNATVTKFWLHGHIYSTIHVIKFCWWRHWQKIITWQSFFQNIFLLRKPRVANFDDIIKVLTMFINTTFKGSKKVKRIRNYTLNHNLYLCFLIKQKLLVSGEKMLTSTELRRCLMWFTYILYLV